MALTKAVTKGVYQAPLAELAQKLNPKSILEIGIGYEAYSTKIWLYSTKANLTTIDKEDWRKQAFNLKKEYPKRFTFIKGLSQDVLPTIKGKFDLVYIDGNHSYEGVKSDIILTMPLVKPGGILLLDDYGIPYGAVDVQEWKVIDDYYGVKQAADELIDWPQAYTDIEFGNGAQAYKRPI